MKIHINAIYSTHLASVRDQFYLSRSLATHYVDFIKREYDITFKLMCDVLEISNAEEEYHMHIDIEEEDYFTLRLSGLLPEKSINGFPLSDFVKKMNSIAGEGLLNLR